ncbi:hypothetical protein [Bradyrhizobium sp. AZCC 1693]|uniref:hypothetical protein n=1 Tax=Bradyrhizobium sp. AZCC 1693 TaxID=3117029 RepID=UPI002FF39647
MPMVAIIFGNPRSGKALAEAESPATTSRKRASRRRGKMKRSRLRVAIHRVPVAAYAMQATDTPQMLRNVDPSGAHPRCARRSRSNRAAAGSICRIPIVGELADCYNFPQCQARKAELNSAGFHQASGRAEIFRNKTPMRCE